MMKTKFRGMTLAAMLLSASTVASGDQNDVTYDGDGYVTPVAFVGDVSSSAEDAYFAEDASFAMRASDEAETEAADAVQSASHTEQQAPQIASVRQPARRQYAPVAASQLRPVGYDMGGYDHSVYASAPSTYSDGGCDVGCDSLAGSKGCGVGKLSSLLNCGGSEGWARSEFLMWFVQDRQSPALVATAPVGDPDFLDTTTVYGDPLESDLSVGFRGDYGIYVSDHVGVGGRFWIIDDSAEDYSRQGNGNDISLGRPYFNTLTNTNDVNIVAYNGLIDGLIFESAGTVEARNSLDMMGAEAYARVNLSSRSSSHLDFLGGYSYFQVDDTLQIQSSTIRIRSQLQPQNVGLTTQFRDSFETENRFNGGQVGFESVVKNGCWTARTLGKVHMGNMRQTISMFGDRTNTPAGGNPINANAGMYVGAGESGEHQRDEFTFVPELNFKLGYSFRKHVEFSVGYTFIYFDNVALAGNYVNNNINSLDLADTNPAPDPGRTFSFKDGSLWVQGIDLGVAVTY